MTPDRFSQLSPRSLTRYEGVLERFEEAWQRGTPPHLAEFLPIGSADNGQEADDDGRVLLEELILIDLEYRWRHAGISTEPAGRAAAPPCSAGSAPTMASLLGQPRLEDYLAHFPMLGPRARLSAKLIGEEYRVRQRWGDRPVHAEYTRRFPDHGPELLAELRRIDLDVPARDEGGNGTAEPCGLRHSQDTTDPPRSTPRIAPARPYPSVPGYEILAELGRGGMGVVYKARHTSLNRLVALKMILAGDHAGAEELARFRAEAELVARLQHPNIVQVYEVGEQHGCPYLALEYIPGGSLATKLSRTPQPPGEAAMIIETLARAVHHAHEQGVVHRDLKPANVLLTTGGMPKITDFGLARYMPGDARQTQSGAILGTPSYMAPEQAAGRAREAGPAADVYALGAILYEMLTGRPPFLAESSGETLLQVLNEEPVPPSGLHRNVSRDLQTISLKCLEKHPSRRYPTAAALADDLQRFLSGIPIQARRISAWGRLSKWARRRPTVAALCALVLLVLCGGFGLVSWQWWLAETARAELETVEYFDRIGLADSTWFDDEVGRTQELLEVCPQALRRWEWHYVKRRCQPELLCMRGHAGFVRDVAFSPDASWVLSASDDGYVRICDAQTGRTRLNFSIHTKVVTCVAISPDGNYGATGGNDMVIRVWSPTTGDELMTLTGHESPIVSVAFSQTGSLLASASFDGMIKVWDATTGKPIRNLPGCPEPCCGLAVSPDGSLIAAVSPGNRGAGRPQGEVKVWEAATGREILPWECGPGLYVGVMFSPDGRYLALAQCARDRRVDENSQIHILDVSTRKRALRLQCPTHSIHGIAFSPDSQRLASADHGGVVRLWNVESKTEGLHLRCSSRVNSLAFSPDGQRLMGGCTDGAMRIWNTALDPVARILPRPDPSTVFGVAFSPDGRWLASGNGKGIVQICDPFSGQVIHVWDTQTKGVLGVAVSPDSRRLATANRDQSVKIWDMPMGQQLACLRGHTALVNSVAFSPDGSRVASGSDDHTIKIWDSRSGQALFPLHGHTAQVFSVVFAPRGDCLASASGDHTIRLWDTQTGLPLRTLEGHQREVTSLAFSPDGCLLASSSGEPENTLLIWDLASGQPIRRLPGHTMKVTSVAFSPDGSRLASTSDDKTVRLWDVPSGRQILTLKAHTGGTTSVAFSPDGHLLATASWDGTVRLWDGTPLEP